MEELGGGGGEGGVEGLSLQERQLSLRPQEQPFSRVVKFTPVRLRLIDRATLL